MLFSKKIVSENIFIVDKLMNINLKKQDFVTIMAANRMCLYWEPMWCLFNLKISTLTTKSIRDKQVVKY